ncbi:PEP-CTERM sorting domain-containing protein [Thermodesulfobacteriota bacterium]
MKKIYLSMIAIIVFVLFIGIAAEVSAYDFSVFSSYNSLGGEYDIFTLGDDIYYRSDQTHVKVVRVSVADPSKKDEAPLLPGGSPNPDYQDRIFTPLGTISLGYNGLNTLGKSELYVTNDYIYGTGSTGSDVVRINNQPTGGGAVRVVTAPTSSVIGGAHFLAYGDGKWWTGNENTREIYSHTGSTRPVEWSYEFTFPEMGGDIYGGGMAYIDGNIWIASQTSELIAQWGLGDNPDTPVVETGWNEWERFSFPPTFGLPITTATLQGMSYGALGHLWVGSADGLYELGPATSSTPIPEPTTMLLLGSGLIGLVGFRRKFKKR